jgi:hypothetical protein
VEAAHGDLRHAVNALQFSSILQDDISGSWISYKQISRNLFSLLGRFLYEKRLPSLVRSDVHQDVDSSKSIVVLSLPSHLESWERDPLEVPPEELLETLPISYDAFNIYLHDQILHFLPSLSSLAFTSKMFSEADQRMYLSRDLICTYSLTLSHGIQDTILDSNLSDWIEDFDDVAMDALAPSQSSSTGKEYRKDPQRRFQSIGRPKYYAAMTKQASHQKNLSMFAVDPMEFNLVRKLLPRLPGPCVLQFSIPNTEFYGNEDGKSQHSQDSNYDLDFVPQSPGLLSPKSFRVGYTQFGDLDANDDDDEEIEDVD